MRPAPALNDKAGPGGSHPRTPVEYFPKDETGQVHPAPATGRLASGAGQGFTFHAHRLSSLWRSPDTEENRLIAGKSHPASSFPKYSAGVWGCKTPTATATDRRTA